MSSLPYESIPEPPSTFSGVSVIIRTLDAAGFRFRWATEGVTDAQADFQPTPESMSIKKICKHMVMLFNLIDAAVGGEFTPGLHESDDFQELRLRVLQKIQSARANVSKLTDAELGQRKINHPRGGEFPIWNMINGPLADALTHVGQITGWRRMAGNPTPKANLFEGKPPQPAS